MKIDFGSSAQSSLGVEWELAVVDLTTLQQVPRAFQVLDHVEDKVKGPIRGEFLTSMVELVTGVHVRVADAVSELERYLQDVTERLDAHQLAPFAAGIHPFGDPAEQETVDKAQYDRVRDRNGWWGRQLAINGLHIHVGLDDREKALPLTQGLTHYLAHFIALTASSPFWRGADTGFASQRTMLFQQLPTNGLPWDVSTWESFESYATQLETVGMITSGAEIRWDVRPTPFGTVENRAMDSVPTLWEIGAVTALAQCLVEYLSRLLDDGKSPDQVPPWFIKENKWRAARYGLEADLITATPEVHTVPLRDDVLRLVTELEPVAADLGCVSELQNVAAMVEHGPSYQRQRTVAAASDGDCRAVLRSVLDETRQCSRRSR